MTSRISFPFDIHPYKLRLPTNQGINKGMRTTIGRSYCNRIENLGSYCRSRTPQHWSTPRTSLLSPILESHNVSLFLEALETNTTLQTLDMRSLGYGALKTLFCSLLNVRGLKKFNLLRNTNVPAKGLCSATDPWKKLKSIRLD